MCEVLSEIAESMRITVAAVVHQIQAKGFAQFERIMILQRGGAVAFHGTHQQAQVSKETAMPA